MTKIEEIIEIDKTYTIEDQKSKKPVLRKQIKLCKQ